MKYFAKGVTALFFMCFFAVGLAACSACNNNGEPDYVARNNATNGENAEVDGYTTDGIDTGEQRENTEHGENDARGSEVLGEADTESADYGANNEVSESNGETSYNREEILNEAGGNSEVATEDDTGESAGIEGATPDNLEAYAARAFSQIIDLLHIPAGTTGAFDIGLSLNASTTMPNLSNPPIRANVRFITNGNRAETLFSTELNLGGFLGTHDVIAYTLREGGAVVDTRLFFGDMELQAETIRLFGLTEVAEFAAFDIQGIISEIVSQLPEITPELFSDFSIGVTKLPDEIIVSLLMEGADYVATLFEMFDMSDEIDFSTGHILVSSIANADEVVHTLVISVYSHGKNILGEDMLVADLTVMAHFNATGNAVRITLP